MRPIQKPVRRGRSNQERGSALAGTLLIAILLSGLTLVSVGSSITYSTAIRSEERLILAREVAESGVAQALGKFKEGGLTQPFSGNGSSPDWVSFDDGGSFYYSSAFDAANDLTTIRAWGRVPYEADGSGVTGNDVDPNSSTYDDTGYASYGVEILVESRLLLPNSPMYFGNGGVERPLGGFSWASGVDPANPATWVPISSSPSSYQTSSVPFEVSALNHPVDFLTSGTPPQGIGELSPLHAARVGYATQATHPYRVWVSQTDIGQYNVDAWFANSANPSDATTGVTPSPSSGAYPTDPMDVDHPYAVESGLPDVQSYAWDLWSAYKDNPAANRFDAGGTVTGTFGDLADPQVTMVTGTLSVPAGQTLRGTGVLVVRDDYDPNVDSNNTPSRSARIDVSGTLEWTGLIVIAGWRPNIRVRSGGEMTLVGSMFGEDSVQSGGEVSLDSATITIIAQDNLRVLYSHDLFEEGGLIRDLLPRPTKVVLGARRLR